MGGINTVATPRTFPVLKDPRKSTIVIGAHVAHQTLPGHRYSPSFASIVSNVDSEAAKYIADCRPQAWREELIKDLEAMATAHIAMYKSYQQNVEKQSPGDPEKITFYRTGVSEGQLKHVLDFGAQLLQFLILPPRLIQECAMPRNCYRLQNCLN